MVKKIIGGILVALGAGLLINSIVTGSLTADEGSAAATYGSFTGQMLVFLLYVLSGIFLIRYDRVKKLEYSQGLKLRKKQNTKTIVITVAYFICFFSAIMGAQKTYFANMDYIHLESYMNYDNYLLLSEKIEHRLVMSWIIAIVIYCLPMMVFAFSLDLYAIPYWGCKKIFKTDEAILNVVLSEENKFYAISEDKSVFTNGEAVFFPNMFCVIPFDQIESMKELNLLVIKEVVFKLNNGKKITVITKAYQNILNTVNTAKAGK